MKLRILAGMVVPLLVLGACSYDDSSIKERVTNLEEDVARLQQTVSTLNSTVEGLGTIVTELQKGDYITAISEVKDGDDVIGYTITFSSDKTITIYNGEDGTTPAVSVKKDEDGVYYWTVNGEWLTADGAKVPATGAAPQLRVADGVWQVSTDGGSTWTNVEVSGYSGVIFQSVEVGDSSVTFTLADGTTFSVPKLGAFGLVFPATTFNYNADSTFTVSYTLTGGDASSKVLVFAQSGVSGKVTKASDTSGSIAVEFTDSTYAGDMVVLASNGKGQKDFEILSFQGLVFRVESVDFVSTATGGDISFGVSSNVEYTVNIPDDAKSWLSLVETKVEAVSSTVTLSVAENLFKHVRSAVVTLTDVSGAVLQSVTVAQTGANYAVYGTLDDIVIKPASK